MCAIHKPAPLHPRAATMTFKQWRQPYSQEKAGRILGVHRRTVIRWEMGDSRVPHWVRRIRVDYNTLQEYDER